MDSSGRHHTDHPAVRPPAGATDTVPFTASTDDTVAAKACQRDVIAPACALPYVISQYAGLDAFEGLPVLEAAALLAMQPDKQGQAAWAWQNSTGKSRQKCADGMSVSLLGSHDRLGHWISATITTALGLLAADANPKLCIRVREAVQTWRVEALDVVIVWAARASADERTPNHIATHDGQLGDPTDLDKILTGIAEFESEVLKPFWGEAGQAEMLPESDHKLKGAFGLRQLATECRSAGIVAAGTLEVLGAVFKRVARAGDERRAQRGKPVWREVSDAGWTPRRLRPSSQSWRLLEEALELPLATDELLPRFA